MPPGSRQAIPMTATGVAVAERNIESFFSRPLDIQQTMKVSMREGASRSHAGPQSASGLGISQLQTSA